jgi:hypothetical protein
MKVESFRNSLKRLNNLSDNDLLNVYNKSKWDSSMDNAKAKYKTFPVDWACKLGKFGLHRLMIIISVPNEL